jgi:hypothetical protein
MTTSSQPRHRLYLALLLLGSSTLPAWAATLTVTSPLESGAGTLRQMLFDADAGDTIVFDLNYPAVLQVSIGALTLGTPVSIVGPGAYNLALDATGNGQSIFIVPPGGSADISGLGLRNGSAGAVRNGGMLTLSHMLFEDNRTPIGGGSGGAILNTGVLAVSDSIFRGNHGTSSAGALFNNGDATIERCSFIDNESPDGGAIVNDGTMTVDASTFSNNRAVELFGGAGGAIRNNAVMELTNSTLSGNECNGAGGAIHNHGVASLTIAGSTIMGNFAQNSPGATAIFRYGAVTISRSIIAGSCGGGALTSTGDNLGTTGTCVPDSLALNDGNHANLALDPLAQNGGPTLTRLLPPGSPAIDAVRINSADCTGTDQRGLPRVAGPLCDIGAVEMESAAIFADSFE